MKFGMKKNDTMMQHLMLCDYSIVEKVVATDGWKVDKELHATLQINGVEVPAEVMESFMLSLWERAKSQYEDETKCFRKSVEEKARQILQDSCGSLLDVMGNLQDKLSDVDSLIKYNWED